MPLVVDPLKRSTDKVAIVGMAATSRHMAPWDDPTVEIWALNESYHPKNVGPDKLAYMKRWTRWFQMHPGWDYWRDHNFNDEDHPKWLRNEGGNRRREDFPIYMLEEDDGVPGSVRYPIEQIAGGFELEASNGQNVCYFTNTFGLMLALAVWMKFSEIQVYGFEMASETEYSQQKPNAEFWLGITIGRGIRLVLPKNCELLGEKVPLYGYEKVPGITFMHLEIRRNAAGRKGQEYQAELNRILGAKQELINRQASIKAGPKTTQAFHDAIAKMLQDEINTRIRLQGMLNELHAYETMMRDLKGLPDPKDVPLVLPKDQIQIVGSEFK